MGQGFHFVSSPPTTTPGSDPGWSSLDCDIVGGMSLIGAFYYLRVVKFMYFDEPAVTTPLNASGELQIMLSINGIATALLGLMPGTLLKWCEGAMKVAFTAAAG